VQRNLTQTLDRDLQMYDMDHMRTAEIELNKSITVRVNDREHHKFKVKCVTEGVEMAELIRAFMREYANGKGKK